MVRRYKLFLASSQELSAERKEIALLVNRLNNKWLERNIYLQLVIWEDLLQSFRPGGETIQDYFNRELLACHIAVVLFFKKMGQFTEEEYRLAYESLKKGEKPRFLFVFFKSAALAIEDFDEDILKIVRLKREIQEEKQVYGTFASTEDLILKLQNQLELAIVQGQAAAVQEDKASGEERAKLDLEHYSRHLEDNFKHLDFTGLNAILQKPLALEDVFIPLRAGERRYEDRLTVPADLEQLARELKEKKSSQEGKDVAAVFREQHKEAQKQRRALRLLILGHPGSGKTTWMKWLALQCATEKDKRRFFSRFTPVFISLKHLGSAPDDTYRKRNIANLCIDLLERENISIDSFFETHFKANRLLFLLDGLDEIGDEKIRREVIDWIQKQYLGQNSLIVTSRFSGLKESEGIAFRDDMPVYEIEDFNPGDMETFLDKWYRGVEIAVGGERGTQKAIEEAERKQKDLVQVIQASKSLQELAKNPLLLTIIAVVHRTRAVLPRDRHRLYEECLKVMIELWNLANRKIDISFSFENSMAHLSKVAVRLMESNRRELGKKEIENCLPKQVEGQTRDFFLKEMVLKAGLLYESEGQYGFLHLTFQEYLAAWYFAHAKDQNDILKHHQKDYWQETFKLFVNIGNTELFFHEIIDHIIKKEYWKNINLWEDCLKEIVMEEIRQSIELSFAKRVIYILSKLEYEKKNDELIEVFRRHHSLYFYASKLEKEGWHLFHNAPHPFVQAIGSSILFRVGNQTRKKLAIQLKKRISDFEEKTDQNSKDTLYFLLSNNNSFVLLVWCLNLQDFYFTLIKMKSKNLFSQYLILPDFSDLLDFLDFPDFNILLGSSILRVFRDLRAILILIDLSDTQVRHYFRVLRNIRDLMDLQSLSAVLSFRSIRSIRGQNLINYLRELLDKYYKKFKTLLENRQREIIEWTDRAIERLHGLSDKKLLEYFPNTTKAELKEFRESYVEVIAAELSKGNCDILKGKTLTKKRQARVEELVAFDEQSVETMLDFVLDTAHEEEKHPHHLKAFEILGNKDYARLFEIIQKFIRYHKDNRIRLNALYIFKNML